MSIFSLKPFVADQTIVFGKKGSGKTCALAKMAYLCHKHDIVCYCTEPNIAYSYYLPYDQIGKLWLNGGKPCVLLIDEIATLFNSRDFKTTPKAVRDFFRYSRHCHCKILSYSQSFNDCDLQLRSLADHLVLCNRFSRNFSTYRRIEKTLALTQDQDGRGVISESYIKTPLLKKNSFSFIYLKKYWKFFDSYSRLDIPDSDNNLLKYTYHEPQPTKFELLKQKYESLLKCESVAEPEVATDSEEN